MPGIFLIIEDHPDQARLLERILLTRYQVEIMRVRDGKTGLELARKHLPDLLLLDLMLPDINGFDVCRQLRQERATMLIPVVMVTALSDMQHRVHGFRVGADAYLAKPFGVEELFEAISAAQSWRTSMQEGFLRPDLQGEVNVELNSEITLLKDLNNFLMNVCQTTPLSNEQAMQLRQAVMEMVHNAIEWGNVHQSERPVKIVYRIHEDHLEIIVSDQGSGSDHEDHLEIIVSDQGSGSDREDHLEIIVSDQGSGSDREDLPNAAIMFIRGIFSKLGRMFNHRDLPNAAIPQDRFIKVLPNAAIPDDPFTHPDVREKLGLRAGGFSLLICQGMVDEMLYNNQCNEVTLIKRFAPRQTP